MSPSLNTTELRSTQQTTIKPQTHSLSGQPTTPPHLMDESNRRSRCDSVTDTRLSICSTSGTVYESVMVVGHIYGSDNIVYYLLEVQSWDMPLEGYVIRRRYNDFKKLHRELAACMLSWNGAAPPKENPLGGYSSLLCHPLSGAKPKTPPMWSAPTAGIHTSYRRSSMTGLPLHELDEDPHVQRRTPHADTRYSAPAVMSSTSRPPWSYQANGIDLPFETVVYHPNGRPLLPELPSGGVSSYFSSRAVLIKQRMEQFNKILAAVLCDTTPEVAQILMKFIQDNPSTQTTYTSLSQYAAIEVPWSVERHARKRATSIGKKTQREQTMTVAAVG